jgi:uncharacterized surface protein with fasciclin (FAS1) repeats
MRRILITLLAGALALSALAFPAAADGHRPSIAEIVVAASGTDGPDDKKNDYDLLLAAVLADDLLLAATSGTGEFEGVKLTVFAPTDRAFMRLTGTDNEADAAAALSGLLGSDTLRNIVLYHVVAGEVLDAEEVFFEEYQEKNTLHMANGDKLHAKYVKLRDGTGNWVTPQWRATDIKASNGIIHSIREVVLPG